MTSRTPHRILKPDLTGVVLKQDLFAEYLSCGFEIPEIAEKMGITYPYANAMMQRIRKGLGKQAV